MNASQLPINLPSSLDEEILKYHIPLEGQNERLQDITEKLGTATIGCRYYPFKYATNYFSAVSPMVGKELKERIRLENEFVLKKYYSSKKLISHANYRHGSVISNSDASVAHSERSKSYMFINKFLDKTDDIADPFDFRLELPGSENDQEEMEKRHIIQTRVASSYYIHYQNLLTVDARDTSIIKRHTLWIPTIKKDFRTVTMNKYVGEGSPYDNKVCPLFIDGTNYIPKEYDTYGGCSMIPSIFSEFKLPAFCYHCSVEINDQVYILGGLVACHKYDEEAPNMKDFDVDGVKNLPPPLLPKIINNPSMVNNTRLYVISMTSSNLMRPEISGHIPPPLLCIKGSKLTERHIFFYGGFEIKTESTVDPNGVYHLKKRAFVNNTGYILDTMMFNFSKIELLALPYKFVTYPTLAARFGHMQVSIYSNNSYGTHGSGQKGAECNENGALNPSENDSLPSESASFVGSPAMSTNSTARTNNANHGSGVYTILIFGGYRQTGDDKYEAMNDLWKIDVPVVARGKRGYYKFGDTANATIISKSGDSEPWPSCRAFFGYCIEEIGLLNKTSRKNSILERLDENFNIDSESFQAKGKSKPIFPNIPHARREPQVANLHSPNKDSYSGANSSLKQRLIPAASASTSTLQKSLSKRHLSGGRVIVIQGGSNKTDVCGDMWWFDLNTETWSQITTYGKDEQNGLVPISVPLVGHSMVNVGHISVCLGGLIQEDVDHLYLGKEVEGYHEGSNMTIGSDILNIFDLTTQCLQGQMKVVRDVNGKNEHVILGGIPRFSTEMIMSFGCTVLHTNGTIVLVGGLVAKRSHIKEIYLRGAILKCVLPSISLAS